MKRLIGVLAIGVSFSATAGTLYCEGAVTALYVGNDGEVVIQPSYRGDWMQVCNLNGSWGGIAGDICYAWYSELLAARTHAQNVLLYYSTTATYTCANLPTYATAPAPGYVMIKN